MIVLPPGLVETCVLVARVLAKGPGGISCISMVRMQTPFGAVIVHTLTPFIVIGARGSVIGIDDRCDMIDMYVFDRKWGMKCLVLTS